MNRWAVSVSHTNAVWKHDKLVCHQEKTTAVKSNTTSSHRHDSYAFVTDWTVFNGQQKVKASFVYESTDDFIVDW